MPELVLLGDSVGAMLRVLGANWDRARRRGLDESPLSPCEVLLLQHLEEFGLEPELQHPIGAYDADFFFTEAKLCVEVDGQYHLGRWERDSTRDSMLRQRGISTLRIPASVVNVCPYGCAELVSLVVADLREAGPSAESAVRRAKRVIADLAMRSRSDRERLESYARVAAKKSAEAVAS